MSDLTAVSLFAGIGGIDRALELAGVQVTAAVEIDPDCRGVLRRHFPRTAIFNDVTEVTGDQLRATGFVPGRGILAGGFPCFVAGTRVLAADGWKPIEDVQVGELVLTHTGRWMPVTSTMSRVSDHQVALRGQGLPHVLTTEEHPFYARASSREWVGRSAGSWRRKFADPEWTDAAKMAGQFASQILPPVEQNEDSADLWWLVGRYLADGWTTTGSRRPSGVYKGNRVVICCAHSEADELAERIDRVVHATRSEDLTATKFIVTRRWFVDFVDRLGRGAAGKTLTRRELTLPADKADALLSGWLSGDGCRTRDQWKGTTVSRSLALSMALLAQRARGIVASLHETAMPSSDVIAGRVVGQRTQYQVVIPDRNRSALIEGAYGWKLVRSATRTDGPVLVYNISVAGDESYVADGAVVHNCQGLSVAGRRKGLADARSGLFWHVMRLADELRPRWLLLENVPGLLSAVCPCPGDETCVDNGRSVECGEWRAERAPGPADELLTGDDCFVCGHAWDFHDAGGFCSPCQDTCEGLPEVKFREVFVANVPHNIKGGACPAGCMAAHGGAMGTVLGALGERGYGFAYRVLDAQFFGVPQRRRRVFIVGCLGDRLGPVEVLLEPEGRERHSTARRPTRTGSAAAVGGGAVSSLQGGGRRGHRVDAEGAAGGHLVAYALGSHAGAADGDQTNRSHESGGPVGSNVSEGIAYSLRAGRTQSVAALPVALRGRGSGGQIEFGEDCAPAFTVRTPGGGASYPMVATFGSQGVVHALTSEGADASEDGTGRGTPIVAIPMAFNPQTGGSAARLGYGEKPTALQANQITAVAIPVDLRNAARDSAAGETAGTGIGQDGDPSFTLSATGRALPGVAMGFAENQRGEVIESAVSHQLTTGGGKPGQGFLAVRQEALVRRLTPTECERLQGFPDGWTDGQADAARYRQLGNSVAVPCVEWITRRLAAVDQSLVAADLTSAEGGEAA